MSEERKERRARIRAMRAALRRQIRRQDIARGRPLTDVERLQNLRSWLDRPDGLGEVFTMDEFNQVIRQ